MVSPILRQNRGTHRPLITRRLRSLPPACDLPTETILPRYFEIYTEVICEHESNKQECLRNMNIPDMEKQQEIARSFDLLIRTYPIQDDPSVKYTILRLMIEGQDDALARLISLLNTYAMSIVMISEMVRNLYM